jgi:hypothetical protein
MTDKKPHPHAELITEWVKDINRPMQFRGGDNFRWIDCDEDGPGWDFSLLYRFKPEEPPKPKIVSSLSDDELYGHPGSGRTRRRAIADAAAQRAIEDLRTPSFFWLTNICKVKTSDQDFALKVILAYIDSVKKGEL